MKSSVAPALVLVSLLAGACLAAALVPDASPAFMADRWIPRDLKNSGHIWLPIQLKAGQLTIPWLDQWDLSWFDSHPQ